MARWPMLCHACRGIVIPAPTWGCGRPGPGAPAGQRKTRQRNKGHRNTEDTLMPTTTLEHTIERAQERLNSALVTKDSAALTELVAPHCRIIGPKGFIVAKDEWI